MKTMTALFALALASLATAGGAQTTGIEERSLADIAAAMADGSATSEAITHAYLARIAAMDRTGPTLRAVIALNPDAMAEARASDARRKAGKPLGPLDGMPMLIKDNIETRDPIPTTAGSLALKDNITHRDAPGGRRAARGGRGDPRQDQPLRMGQHPLDPLDERVERGRRAGAQSLCARSHRLRLVERLGRGGGGELRRGGARHRDRRLGGLPVLDERAGRAQADASAWSAARMSCRSATARTRRGRWARSVRDVAILFSAMVGSDPADPATSAGRCAQAVIIAAGCSSPAR